MKRKITPQEVRHFFETANKQFEEAGFCLNNVHFTRDDDGKLTEIRMSYTEEDRQADAKKEQIANALQNGADLATAVFI